jgi:LssY C-terminus
MSVLYKIRRGFGGTPGPTRTWALIGLLLTVLSSNPAQADACAQLAAGTSFWVRLTASLSSFTAKPGTPVHAFLLESPECDNTPVSPTKIPIEGRVLSVHRVGLGLRYETAALEIAFTRIVPPGAHPIEINGRVRLIDNGREEVKAGVIRGIRSTDTPQGRISSRLKYLPSLHLYPDPFLLGFKMLFPIFPEPEIILDAGTDMQIVLQEAAKLPSDLPRAPPVPTLGDEAELTMSLSGLPERTVTEKGKEADVVDMVFAGSKADLEQAFQTAGWRQSEAVSKHAALLQLYAFLAKTNYPTAPISPQLLQGRKPDLTLEKAQHSYEKRNHLRIWALQNSLDGTPLWASAAVRETGATLSLQHKGFIHHVSEDLAEEQRAVVRDLLAADCVAAVGSIPRPAMDHLMRNATGEFFRTDGSLTVVRLKPCTSDPRGVGFNDSPGALPSSRSFRYLRRQILTVRSDLWRANCIYSLFDLTRVTIGAIRQNSSNRAVAAEFRQEITVRPATEMVSFPSEEIADPHGATKPCGNWLESATSRIDCGQN